MLIILINFVAFMLTKNVLENLFCRGDVLEKSWNLKICSCGNPVRELWSFTVYGRHIVCHVEYIKFLQGHNMS